MDERTRLLGVYDEQLRGASEVVSATWSTTRGPLWLAGYDTHGLVTYRSLDGLSAIEVASLIDEAAAYFGGRDDVTEWEWKTRSHDGPPDVIAQLGERLLAAGLEPEELETVMLGAATSLAVEVALPAGVRLLCVDDLPDGSERRRWLGRAAALQRAVFGRGPTDDEVVARSDRVGEAMQFWVAAVGDQVVCAGRVEIVPGTECAGLWGGATHPDHRGQGIYRALVSARARACLDLGVRYLHSDCSPMSRPILERSGLVAVTTSTPYVGRAGSQSGSR